MAEIGEVQEISDYATFMDNDEDIDFSRVFSFKHRGGEIISGNVLDIQSRCVGMAGLALKHVFSMAEAMEMGQNLLSEDPEKAEEAERTETSEAEKTGDGTELNAATKVIKENTKEAGHNAERIEPEAAKPQRLAFSDTSKQEARIAEIVSGDELTSDGSSEGLVKTPATATEPKLSEKTITATPAVEALLAEVPVVSEAPASKIENSYTVEKQDTEPVIVNKSDVPTSVAEDEQIIEAAGQEPEVQNNTDDAEAILEGTKDDGEFELKIQIQPEPQLSEDFTEFYAPKEQPGEDFVTSSQELTLEVSESTLDSQENVIELSVPVEEAEQTILQIADNIEQMDAEKTETAHQILDEIIEKIPEMAGLKKYESTNEFGDAKEELKELFIQLFDYVEVEYSPELIDSIVKLALQGELSELLTKVEEADENTLITQGSGTHEVINKLLAGISNIKKSLQQAYQIGKSALQLYISEFSVAGL